MSEQIAPSDREALLHYLQREMGSDIFSRKLAVRIDVANLKALLYLTLPVAEADELWNKLNDLAEYHK